MKYILLLITIFLSPVYAMLLITFATKILAPKLSVNSNELTLMPIPKNIFLISILLDISVGFYVFQDFNLIQTGILLLIISCLVITYTSATCNKVVCLSREKGFFTTKKVYSTDQEDIKVSISIQYSVDEDKNGKLDELGVLQFSFINEKAEVFTNYFRFDKDKYVLKFLSLVHKYKNIEYLIDKKRFCTFDEAFTYIVNNSSSNKNLIEKNKDNFIELYENANPNGDFKNLQIPLNYK